MRCRKAPSGNAPAARQHSPAQELLDRLTIAIAQVSVYALATERMETQDMVARVQNAVGALPCVLYEIRDEL